MGPCQYTEIFIKFQVGLPSHVIDFFEDHVLNLGQEVAFLKVQGADTGKLGL